MGNMSYCRFENTARDLSDCVENWDEDEDLNDYEKSGKQHIIELAREIIDMAGDDEWILNSNILRKGMRLMW